MSPPEPLWRWLGCQPYEPVARWMHDYTDARDSSSPDVLLALEHSPVFTLGQAGKPEHILDAGDIADVRSDRGGQVTYHGPGQLIVDALVDLPRAGLSVRQLVNGLEQAVIGWLQRQGRLAERRDGAPGVYVEDAKIAALGLRVRRGRSLHGLSFNVAMDLEPFARINPCGFKGLAVTDLTCLGLARTPSSLAGEMTQEIAAVLGLASPHLSESVAEPLQGDTKSIASGDALSVGAVRA